MAYTQDPNLGLYYGWNYGEEPWNEEMDKNLVILGGMACLSVLSATNTTPPSTVDGDVYFIPTGATGAWVGKDNNIAIYEGQRYNEWLFIPAESGWMFTIADNAKPTTPFTFNGSTLVESVDVSGYLTASSSYTATGAIDFSGKITFSGTHTTDTTELATLGDVTAAIDSQDFTGYVDITTDQTVGGVKTFTSSPVIPDALNNDEAASLGQVSTQVSAIDGSNVGGYSEVYKQKIGSALEYRTLQSSDSSVSITQNDADIDFTVSIPTSVESFLNLNDTPTDYSSSYGYSVRVSATDNELVFIAPFAETYSALTDVDGNYVGNAGKVASVNSSEDGLEFIDPAADGVTTYLGLTDTPNSYTSANWLARINDSNDGLEFVNPSNVIIEDFTGLNDTPSDYTGSENYLVTVNATGDGLEFKIPSSGGVSNFTDLDDTPSTYSGNAGSTIVVNSSEDGVEFIAAGSGTIAVQDEGTAVGTAPTLNFIGNDVNAVYNATDNRIDIYIPSVSLTGSGSLDTVTSANSSWNGSYALLGDTVTAVDLSWSYNPDEVATQSFTGSGSSTLTAAQRVVSISSLTLTDDSTWGFTGDNDDFGTANFSIPLQFANMIYYGRSASATLTEAQIEALGNSNQTDDHTTTYNFSSGSGYLYICYPTRLGELTRWDNLNSSFDVITYTPVDTISITNSLGYTETYYVQRTENELSSAFNIQTYT